MTNIKDKPGGRPAKKRIEKQQRVVSTKLTELQVAVELVKLKNRIVEIINQLSDDWKNKKGKRV